MLTAAAPVPLTVIGGFLGAGKTTLLNHLLSESRGVRYAVLVNDFGDLAVDGDLVAAHGGDTVTFANGCVCCTLGDNLLETIDRLLGREPRPQQFVVEASGVADPRAIADLATLHPELRRDLIVVVADAGSVQTRAMDARLEDTVRRQLECADLIVLNQCDRVHPAQRDEAERWLASTYTARTFATSGGCVPAELMQAVEGQATSPRARGRARGHAHHHPFSSVTLPVDSRLDLVRLRSALGTLGPSVLRVKGFVQTRDGAGDLHRVELAGRQIDIAPWVPAPGHPHPVHALVLIGLDGMPGADTLARAVLRPAGDRPPRATNPPG